MSPRLTMAQKGSLGLTGALNWSQGLKRATRAHFKLTWAPIGDKKNLLCVWTFFVGFTGSHWGSLGLTFKNVSSIGVQKKCSLVGELLLLGSPGLIGAQKGVQKKSTSMVWTLSLSKMNSHMRPCTCIHCKLFKDHQLESKPGCELPT